MKYMERTVEQDRILSDAREESIKEGERELAANLDALSRLKQRPSEPETGRKRLENTLEPVVRVVLGKTEGHARNPLLRLLAELGACEPALRWVRQHSGTSLEELWADCDRADWLVWLASEMRHRPGWPDDRAISHAVFVSAGVVYQRNRELDPEIIKRFNNPNDYNPVHANFVFAQAYPEDRVRMADVLRQNLKPGPIPG
jgi:hypothetical protein